jgi:hypothetical protein
VLLFIYIDNVFGLILGVLVYDSIFILPLMTFVNAEIGGIVNVIFKGSFVKSIVLKLRFADTIFNGIVVLKLDNII